VIKGGRAQAAGRRRAGVPGLAEHENDEVVFLGRDLGGKVAKAEWPSGTKATYEVEVTDPLSGAKGYAYVASYASASSAPPPSQVRI
jgi:hypothetical protein